ncbi:MAG: carbohydrate kinase family protein [Patescibacteria group bacterium]
MESRILVSGSLAYDRIMNFGGLFSEHFIPGKSHDINVSFALEDLRESFGGTAGNIAYSLALLGMKPFVLARVGHDFAPYRSWLANRGVDTHLLELDEALRTAFAMIMTDRKDNQITAFYPGAMEKPYTIPERVLGGADFAVIAPGNPEDMRRLPEYYRANAIPFMYDPGQQMTSLTQDDLKEGMRGAKIFIVNDYEMAMTEEKTGLDEKGILEHAEIVVTTLGDKGSRIATKAAVIEIPPAKPENEDDPTGAGDAYRAGFIFGLLNDWPLAQAGRLGGLVACYTIELAGTQTHAFTLDDVQSRYRENFKESLPPVKK